MYCPKCGTDIGEYPICPKCGTKQFVSDPTQEKPQEEISRPAYHTNRENKFSSWFLIISVAAIAIGILAYNSPDQWNWDTVPHNFFAKLEDVGQFVFAVAGLIWSGTSAIRRVLQK